MRLRLAALFLLIWFCPRLCAAQREIVIPVVVTNQSGSHVSNLQKTDFSVQAKDSTLINVDEVNPLLARGAAGAAPLFILYDAISVPPPYQGNVSESLLALLSKAAATNETIGLVVNSSDGLQVIHNPVTGNDVLAAAIDRLSSTATNALGHTDSRPDQDFETKVSSEYSRLQLLKKVLPNAGEIPMLPTASRQLEGLQRTAAMLQRSSGRKILGWIGAYFPIQVNGGELMFGSWTPDKMPQLNNLAIEYENTIALLSSAHVSVSPLQVEGPSPKNPAFSHVEDTRAGLELLARQTGGVLLKSNTRTVSEAVAEAREMIAPYYLLHFAVRAAASRLGSTLRCG